ncbi:MAG: RNA polymerase sigma factor [Acidimicrobiales bacterium]
MALTSSTLSDLRLADRSLRRYVAHMTDARVDDVLHRAYVAAIGRGEPPLDGDRASIPMFREVQVNLEPSGLVVGQVVEQGDGLQATGLDSIVGSLPPDQRSALLLITLEGFSVNAAAEILGLPEPSVALLQQSAADTVGDRWPAWDGDTGALRLALGDLPVEQATPMFWTEVESDLALEPVPASPLQPVLLDYGPPTDPDPLPPTESIWPAVWAGAGALIVALGMVALAIVRTDGEQTATENGPAEVDGATLSTPSVSPTVVPADTVEQSGAGSPSAPSVLSVPAAAADALTTAPSTTGPSTTARAATTRATRARAPTVTSTRSPTSVAAATAPTTPPAAAAAPTTTPATTTAPPPAPGPADPARAPGPADRGDIGFTDGSAIVAGSLAAGATEFWRIEIMSGQTLTISTAGLNGVELSIFGPEGVPLEADYSDAGLRVTTAAGVLNLLVTDTTGSGADYTIGLGIADVVSGFLATLDADGTGVSALAIVACSASDGRLEATLVVQGGTQQIAVKFDPEADPNTVSFLGELDAIGQILSSESVPTGRVFVGTIVGGPDGLLGFPFWLAVYGCEAGT